ncbi:MAG TPA: hypothetical protein VHB47_01045, partial [Thermoanaerobaculia bacterium]|nr:hypothetical protein [Thermoanaerobaculia bacterium]
MTGVPARSRHAPAASSALLLGALLALAAHRAAAGQPPAAAAPASPPAAATSIEINGGMPLFIDVPEVTITGSTDAPAGSAVEVSIAASTAPSPAPATPPVAAAPPVTATAATSSGAAAAASTQVPPDGHWSLRWPSPLAAGAYAVRATVRAPGGASASALADLVVQLPGRFPRRPLLSVPESYASPVQSAAADFQEFTDRWRVVLPPYELTVPGSRFDPYNQNRWKGDLPIRGQDLFLNLSAVADTLVEPRQLPTPSGVGSARPGSLQFFGRDGQLLATETIALSADLFKGDTAFRPIDWRIKASLVADVNYLRVAENGIVNPDVRQGTSRTDGFVAVQELFGELKLADLSPNYDFVSVRAGIQPFNSDFRGFLFT